MTLVADASDTPHHPGCTCGICELYRTSKAYDEAALVYYELQSDDLPTLGTQRPGNPVYRPHRPFLKRVEIVIGLSPERSYTTYKWCLPGTSVEETITIPATLTMSDPL